MALPEGSISSSVVRGLLGVDEALQRKAAWIDRYKAALASHLPEAAAFSQAALTTFCSALMDANMFAGGQSVPSVIGLALALPYSAWGEANLPSGFSLDDTHTHAAYIYEVMRRFPPVAGYGWTERSAGNAPAQQRFANLNMAMLDPRVFPEPYKLEFRKIADYHRRPPPRAARSRPSPPHAAAPTNSYRPRPSLPHGPLHELRARASVASPPIALSPPTRLLPRPF